MPPIDLHLDLDATPGPKRARLERALREAVREGRLHPGARLPATRTLARELGVSRGVVVEAYEQLAAEGWLAARRGAGTVVAGAPESAPAPARRAARAGPPPVYDLRTGRPDLAAFPRRAWHAALGRALRTLPDAALGYGDPRGLAGLRTALTVHLGRARGVVARPEDVVVCAGLAGGLPALWRALAARGARRIGVEDPGWRGQRRSVEVAGLDAVAVPVDERGLVVEELGDVDAVCVTPAHQFPLGGVLAPERRAALLAWARRTGGLVVEDDYDAEYRYDREPVGALQGLAPDRVVFAGSASKTLAPALRLGWLVAPPWLAPGLAAAKDAAARGTPALDQAALADLLERGELDRHLRRMRRRYRARRDALVTGLAAELPEARVGGIAAGLHAVAWLPDGADERAIVERAAAAGVAVEGVHDHSVLRADVGPALLLGYAAEPEPALGRAVRLLAGAVRACAARGTRPAASCSPPARR